MAPPLLNLDGIKLTFGGTPLLDGASLSAQAGDRIALCLLYTSPSPRDRQKSRMPSSA